MKYFNTATISLALAATAPAFAQADSMQGMDMHKTPAKGEKATVHQAAGIVKSVDAGAGKVTLEHGPVKTLDWPAMTMTFDVADKRLLGNLGVGRQVRVTFEKRGSGFVITSVK